VNFYLRLSKRAFDLLSSAFALIALAPLFIFVALAIKLTSKGPVFFKQNRVGKHGHDFGMYKFRSMVTNAEEIRKNLEYLNEQSGPVFKIKNDPRITPVGRFIRKYSIDELPQLFNILVGDMSVVGPRPALPSEVDRYDNWHLNRLSVPPGLTCVWQVSGRNSVPFEKWMEMDAHYVKNWSFSYDMLLIVKTLPVVFFGRGG
jgi:exopolysaccharide biosynthesis polyprenyl glycosylphosphotransferase